ncbi:MAG TPA: ABC transporter permease [bacterium]|nr:ABC transporter permease [bacterium]
MPSTTGLHLTVAAIKMFFRDRRALFWSLFFPIMIMGIFGLIDFSRFSLDMGIVVPEDNKLEFAGIVEGLKENEAFNITEGSFSDEQSALMDDKRELVLVFNKTNEGVVEVQALLNASSQTESSGVAKQIKEILQTQVLSQAGLELPFVFEEEVVDVNNLTPLNFILPGVLGIALMNGSIFGVAGAIVRSRERNILKGLFATPLTKTDFLFSQVITRLVVSIFQVSILFLIPIIVNRLSAAIQGIPVEEAIFYFKVVGSWFNLGVITLLGAIVFINFGFAVSAVAKTFDQAAAMVNVIAMPMMFFSGAFFPKEVLPKFIQGFAEYLPLTYLVDGLRETMNKGLGFFELRLELLGLVVWALLIFVISIRLFKWEN